MFQKGLALVLIPLALNGVWIFVLYGALQQTAHLVEVERTRTDELEHMYHATELLMNASGDMFSYLVTRNEQFRDEALAKEKIIEADLKRISNLGNFSPQARKRTDLIMQQMREQMRDIHNVATSMDQDSDAVETVIAGRKQMKRLMRSIMARVAETSKSLDATRADIEALRLEGDASRHRIEQLVMWGFAANILVAVILVVVFFRSIVVRLQTLVENAKRIPNRTPLEPELKGDDELVLLDRAMHSAAKDLADAYEFRAELTQMVAHDLRSPLQASQISLDILSEFESANITPSGIQHIERVKSNHQRSLALISDFLTFESLEKGQLDLELKPRELRPLVDEAINSLAGLASVKGINIQNKCDEIKMNIDSRRIMQVLMNYLTNAIKFSPKKSTIEIGNRLDGQWVTVFVSDQGPGLDDEERAHVFDRFFQAKEGKQTEGFGLGLAICRLIVEAHGGQVGVTSTKGSGAKFWFKVQSR